MAENEIEIFTPHNPAPKPEGSPATPAAAAPASRTPAPPAREEPAEQEVEVSTPRTPKLPSFADLVPGAQGADDEEEPEAEEETEEEEADDFADLDAARDARGDETNAKRRISYRDQVRAELRAEAAAEEADRLRKSQLTPEMVDEHFALEASHQALAQQKGESDYRAKCTAFYIDSLETTRAQMRARGVREEELPVYDRNSMLNYVEGEVSRVKASHQKPLTADDVARVTRREIDRASADSRREYATLAQERESSQRKEKFETDLRAAIKADTTGAVKANAAFWRSHAKEHGYQHPVDKYVKRVTAVDKKTAPLRKAVRAEHSKVHVPLKHGPGAKQTRTSEDPVSIVRNKRMEPADVTAALKSGRLRTG